MEKEKNSKITREEALRRLETARKLKREYVAKLEKEMKEEFKKRTGQEATYFVNPAKRNVMVVKNEMRLLKQKRNVLQI